MNRGVILREDHPIVPQAWNANRPWNRLRGLLARAPLRGDAVQALWLAPCPSVHTFGMGYPLDIVFLGQDGCVLACHESVPPWRMRWCRGARQTVELAPGGIAALAPVHGEEWSWQET